MGRMMSFLAVIFLVLGLLFGMGRSLSYLAQMRWHRAWEARTLKFSVFVVIGVVSASLFEIVPTFAIRSNIKTIEAVTPYTPLELYGRDIYVAEGCYNCHSQMVRPLRFETERFGEYSKAGEFVYDHPFQWGSRRIGPDLHRIGLRQTSVAWHVRHLINPTALAQTSIMPSYEHLVLEDTPYEDLVARVGAMRFLGVPYTKEEQENAPELARAQAAVLGERLVAEGESGIPADSKVIALTAYLLRLGTDTSGRNAQAEGAQ
jgi:cytochrome c oxidase cbb3-type subunit I/II